MKYSTCCLTVFQAGRHSCCENCTKAANQKQISHSALNQFN